MQRYKKIEEEIGRLARGTAIARHCRSILEYVVNHDAQLSSYLTFRHLAKLLNVDAADPELHAAVNLLSVRFNALKLNMEFYEENGDSFRLDKDQMREFVEDGKFVHHKTGTFIESAADRIIPFFSARRSALVEEV